MKKLLILITLAVANPAWAQTFRVVAFNVESGGAASQTISEHMRLLGPADIWGFSEVQSFSWAMDFKNAAMAATGAPYRFVFGNTGGGDRLVLLFNQNTFEELGSEELDDINPGMRVRSPLVVHLRLKATSQEFLAVVNHLYRKRSDLRRQQARKLNEWARQQSIPVIALGDYNFDWESDADHGEGFDLMTRNDVFEWVRPVNLMMNGQIVPTQCHPDFKSVLDFVFVSGDAQEWSATSQILFPEPDYCPDDNSSSDHRPVEAAFTVGDPADDGADETELGALKEAVESLQRALDTVKEQVEALEGNGP